MPKRLKNNSKRGKDRQARQQVFVCDTFRKELGLADHYLKSGRHHQAAGIYRKILLHDPEHLCANYFMGVLLHTANQSYAGISCLKKVIAAQPGHIGAQLVLTDMYLNADILEEAEVLLQKLIVTKPRNAEVLYRLGKLNQQRGRFKEAADYFTQAFRRDRAMLRALLEHARVCAASGDTENALSLYRRVREIRPVYGEAHYGLALLNNKQIDADDIDRMEKAYQVKQLGDNDKAYLAYALGKVYDDLGQYEKAFQCFSEANRVKRRSFPFSYQVQQDDEYFQKIKQVFNAAFVQSVKHDVDEEFRPVFILGMPRSGTTLVEQIVSSHSRVYGAGELEELNNVVNEIQARTQKRFPDALDTLTETDWVGLADQYIKRISQRTGAKVITDKRPYNFRYIGLIAKLFPRARIVHCRRNPVATCFSVYRYHFSSAEPYATDLEDLGKYYRLYENLMAFWQEILPERIHHLVYEDLVENPEKQIKALLAYCDLPFEESCLAFFKNKRSVNTPSASQVRQPLYKKALAHWQHYAKSLEPLTASINQCDS